MKRKKKNGNKRKHLGRKRKKQEEEKEMKKRGNEALRKRRLGRKGKYRFVAALGLQWRLFVEVLQDGQEAGASPNDGYL